MGWAGWAKSRGLPTAGAPSSRQNIHGRFVHVEGKVRNCRKGRKGMKGKDVKG